MMGASNLFGDLQTDEEKASFFLRGDGYASGIIAKSIQADVALAYQRCVSFKHENAAQRATIQQLEARVKGLEEERDELRDLQGKAVESDRTDT